LRGLWWGVSSSLLLSHPSLLISYTSCKARARASAEFDERVGCSAQQRNPIPHKPTTQHLLRTPLLTRSSHTEIKSLDGERKALVYDNYSKLITATDTIRKMRLNMEPLTPTTSTLSPAIAHIAETASSLASLLQQRAKANGGAAVGARVGAGGNGELVGGRRGKAEEKRNQRQTVKWVLDSPRRLQEQINSAEREAAEKEWEEVKSLLERWRGTEGVEEVREACEKVLAGELSMSHGTRA